MIPTNAATHGKHSPLPPHHFIPVFLLFHESMSFAQCRTGGGQLIWRISSLAAKVMFHLEIEDVLLMPVALFQNI